jgi:hypothetical protein
MSSPEAFQICPSHARSNKKKKGKENCGKVRASLEAARDDSLRFGA